MNKKQVAELKKTMRYRKEDIRIDDLWLATCDRCHKCCHLSPSQHRCDEIGIEMERHYSVNINYVCDRFEGFRGERLPNNGVNADPEGRAARTTGLTPKFHARPSGLVTPIVRRGNI